jgi:hypothetical protein
VGKAALRRITPLLLKCSAVARGVARWSDIAVRQTDTAEAYFEQRGPCLTREAELERDAIRLVRNVLPCVVGPRVARHRRRANYALGCDFKDKEHLAGLTRRRAVT